ncbi:MAG: hypothetical protein ABI791_12805 [Acidobacteriota bacterium]
MRLTKIITLLLASLVFVSSASAQRAEVTITLDERFFDALLDGIFQNAAPPEFSIASNDSKGMPAKKLFGNSFASGSAMTERACPDSVRLLREMNGVRTAVRFRDGKILAPLAFSGGYAPPFVGCVDFAGWAETNIELEFDQPNQRLVARALVGNVALNGTGGMGGTVIAKMIQSAIDKKVNPIELMKLDKISFTVPIQNSGTMRMKAVGVRSEVVSGAVKVHLAYEFLKG